ncbi:hypothetical protein [Rhodococcus sp. NPDC060176]|uniref:hypothetical protein n=1 Tax=Rhodococcus sp. NPDC060176 TaxID=3347062 RepID=UPI0036531D06
MGYEHQPTPGPAVWIGAGLLVAVGGAALLWVSRVDAGDVALAVAGWITVVVGLTGIAVGVWRAILHRQRPALSGHRQKLVGVTRHPGAGRRAQGAASVYAGRRRCSSIGTAWLWRCSAP